MPYEYHDYQDPKLRVIFHLDRMQKSSPEFNTHWHENIELLYFVEGEAKVQSDDMGTAVKAGEIAVINSNHLHSVHAESEQCTYYCLIIDKTLCDALGISADEHFFPPKTSDDESVLCFQKIVSELSTKHAYYRPLVKSYCGAILARLARICSDTPFDSSTNANKKIEIVKDAIQYMYEHFEEDITVDDICRAIGFSKYYFCHTFKEITGQTAVRHLNFIRCNNARALLSSGKHNVVESALISGFRNPSYFSKTYKKLIGNLPSKDARE